MYRLLYILLFLVTTPSNDVYGVTDASSNSQGALDAQDQALLTDQEVTTLGVWIERRGKGFYVRQVLAANHANPLKRGDRILSINGTTPGTLADFLSLAGGIQKVEVKRLAWDQPVAMDVHSVRGSFRKLYARMMSKPEYVHFKGKPVPVFGIHNTGEDGKVAALSLMTRVRDGERVVLDLRGGHPGTGELKPLTSALIDFCKTREVIVLVDRTVFDRKVDLVQAMRNAGARVIGAGIDRSLADRLVADQIMYAAGHDSLMAAASEQ